MGAANNSDELTILSDWAAAGRKAALATVVSTWGSSPRPVGSHMVVNDQGEFRGSVSGGCIEGAVVAEALEVMATRNVRHIPVVDSEGRPEGVISFRSVIRYMQIQFAANA